MTIDLKKQVVSMKKELRNKYLEDNDLEVNVVLDDLENVNLESLYNFEMPVVGYNCGSINFIDNRSKIIDYGILDMYKDVEHNSLYHLETIKEHINSVYNLATTCELKKVAKYHDIGKFYVEQTRYGLSSFINHGNISTYLYLLSKEEVDLRVAYLIYFHSTTNKSSLDIDNSLIEFKKLDRLGSVELPFHFLKDGKKRAFILEEHEPVDEKYIDTYLHISAKDGLYVLEDFKNEIKIPQMYLGDK